MIWGRLDWVVSRLNWVGFWVLSNTFVSDISNISTVSITNIIGYDLSTTIGKIDTVFTSSGVSITVFVGLEVSFSVVVMYSISVFIDSWSNWFFSISWGWGMISWSCVYNWLMYNWGNIWSWFVDNWGMIWSWLVDNWSWVVNWGVVNWGWVVNGSCVIYWSRLVINWGWVIWSSMVDGSMSICWGMDRDMSRSMNSSTVLFSSIWVVYVLWSGMGLARDGGVVSSMGLVYSNFDGWGVAVLDNLMTALVSQSNSQKSG